MEGSRDVGGEGVQQALLRMMEGSVVTVQGKSSGFEPPPSAAGEGRSRPGTRGQSPPPREWYFWIDVFPYSWIARPDSYNIDTSNVLFILSGAFVGLDTVVKRRVAKGVCDQFYTRPLVAEISPTLVSLSALPPLWRLKMTKRMAEDFCRSSPLTGEHPTTFSI